MKYLLSTLLLNAYAKHNPAAGRVIGIITLVLVGAFNIWLLRSGIASGNPLSIGMGGGGLLVIVIWTAVSIYRNRTRW